MIKTKTNKGSNNPKNSIFRRFGIPKVGKISLRDDILGERKKTKKVSFIRVFGLITTPVLVIFAIYIVGNFCIQKSGDIMTYISGKTKTMQEDFELGKLKKGEKIELSNKTLTQAEIVANLSKLTLLPQEEISMLVKVKNSESLKAESPIYNEVQDGNYILIYTSLAYIYDADANKLIKIVTLR